MEIVLRKLAFYIILLLLVYFFTELLVYGFHYVVFKPDAYISYTSSTIHLTKYFALGMIVAIIGFKVIDLTKFGKRFFSTILAASVLGFLVTSLWFNAVNEEEIVKFRVFYSTSYSWDEVEHISTNIYHESGKRAVAGARSSPRKVIKEYNFHITDSSSLNVWSGIDSIYTLHKHVMKENIDTFHLTDAEQFDFRFTNYFKEDLERAYLIFGIT